MKAPLIRRLTPLITMALLSLFIATDVVLANTNFIPNHRRHRREVGHNVGTAWSQRREVGLQYLTSESTYSIAGVKNRSGDTTNFSPNLFYNDEASGFGVDGYINLNESKTDYVNPSTDDSTSKTTDVFANFGYEFPHQQMAIGLSYNQSETKEDEGTTPAFRVRHLGASFGYRLENQIYLGAGILRLDTKQASDKDEYNYINLGGGKVFGGSGGGGKSSGDVNGTLEAYVTYLNEDSVKSYTTLFSGLINRENLQYHADLGYNWQSGSDDKTTRMMLEAGVDVALGRFYVDPQLRHTIVNRKSDTSADTKTTSLSLEGGARFQDLEVFLRYDTDKTDYEYPNVAAARENKATTIVVGATCFF